MTSACTVHPFRDHLVGGNVRCRRGPARHRSLRQSFGHASQRNKSLAASPPLTDQWDRSHLLKSRRRPATTGAPSPQLHRLHYRHSARNSAGGFVQSGFCEIARYDRARGWPLPRDLTEPSRFPSGPISDSRPVLGTGASMNTLPYSEDIRERALARADGGETVRSIAKTLQISLPA